MEGHAVGFHFLARHRQRRLELSVETALLRHRNLPDAEESEHVVDAVGVEILRHLAEAAHPPLTAVLHHLVPVVGGEAPVLSVFAEGIGRSACLPVEVEVARLSHHVGSVAVDADGNVALQDDALLACVLVGAVHLLVEVKLHIVPECCRAAFVTIDAELGVRLEPLLVLLDEVFVDFRTAHLCSLLCIELMQVFHLRGEHALIVNLRQRVQLLAQLLIVGAALLVFQLRQLAQIRILRMQGIDADAVVGIAVLPRAGSVGVIDGQHLQDALAGLRTPVDHQFQVAEVAHAEASL